MDTENHLTEKPGHPTVSADGITVEAPINASGHRQELEQNFSLFSICGIAVTTGESWIVLGNSIVLAIYNGGPPGVIYGFISDSIFYCIVAASVAELASSMPSSGTVYHWATITGGRYGRVCGWFAGWWNFLAWVAGAASLVSFMALQTVAIYTTANPNLAVKNWHIFISYLACTWLCCLTVLFANKFLPRIESTGAFFIVGGFLVSVIVCAVMPYVNGRSYTTNAFVWRNWTNNTGWKNNGFVFCQGMLNAAFAVCAPDIPSHMAEEIPRPSINVPKAILAQYVASFLTGFCYLITIFYAISDLDAILATDTVFPLSLIYRQATGSDAATVGLLVVSFIPTFIGAIGGFTIVGRTFWAMSRDRATPFSGHFSTINPKTKNPFNAILLSGVLVTLLGFIYLGSARAFNDIAGSFVILTSLSYLAAILPHLLGGRRHMKPNYFWMKGIIGYIVNAIGCAYLIAFIVIFCFPFSLPVTPQNMNYSSLIVGGLTLSIAVFWTWKRGEYSGPQCGVEKQEMDGSS